MSFKKLRKVRPHEDVIEPDDHNNLVDNLKIAYNILQDRLPKIDPTIIDKLDELKSLINKMRYVQYGDYVFADDHNMLVDAFNKVADICETLKRLAFVPKETYSIVARAKARVLASSVEKLPYKESYSLTTSPITLDPNDPTWTPAEGWDKVWQFESSSEISDFGNNGYDYAYVEDGLLKFNPPSGDSGHISRADSYRYKRVAIAFRIKIISISKVIRTMYVVKRANTHSSYTTIIDAYSQTELRLRDEGSGSSVVFTNTENWYALVVDYDVMKARVYDINKNLIAEVDVTWESFASYSDMIYIYEYNTSDLVEDVEIDWVAIKYA